MGALVMLPKFPPPVDWSDPLQHPSASVRVVGTGFVHRASLRKFNAHVEHPQAPLIVHCRKRLKKATITERAVVCLCCTDDSHDVTEIVMAGARM